MQPATAALGVQLYQIEVRLPNDFENAFSKITGTVRATGLFLQSTAMFIDNRKRMAELTTKHRLPAIYDAGELAEAGVLMSYDPDRFDLGPACRHLRRQDPERCEARRSPRRAADEIRVHHQSQSRQSDRLSDPDQCVGKSRQNNQVRR